MAYAVVSHGAAAGTGSAVPSVTLNTTGADRIFLAPIDWFGVQPLAVVDNKGNTYTALTDYNNGVNFNCGAQILYSQNSPAVGSGHSFTGPSGQNAASLAVLAVSGSAANPFDTGTDKGNSVGSGTTISPSAACVPNNDNEIVIAVWAAGNSGQSPNIPTHFLKSDSIDAVSGTNYGVAMYYEIQTTAASRQPTITWTNSATVAIAIAAFKAAAAVATTGWGLLLGGQRNRLAGVAA